MKLELQTVEDFSTLFPNEKSSIDFLWKIRDMTWKSCPRCHGERFYDIENGKRRKCANNQCYNRYKVGQGSLLHGSNIPFKDWLYCIFMYTRTKGRFSSSRKIPSYTFSTVYMIDEKIKILFKNIPKTGTSTDYIFLEACKNIYLMRGQQAEMVRRVHFFGKPTFEEGVLVDLSNEDDYKKVVLFATRNMYKALREKWIFHIFCSPEEIVAETYIFIAETGLQQVSSDFIIAMVRKVQGRMYAIWVKNNPRVKNWIQLYAKNWKADQREKLGNYYLKNLIDGEKNNKGIWKEELTYQQVQEKLTKKREEVVLKRSKNNYQNNKEIEAQAALRIVVKENTKYVWD